MENLYIILILTVILIIGFVKIKKNIIKIKKDYEFIFDYRTKFIVLSNNYFKDKGNFDEKIYIWLTMNADRVQRLLGSCGEMDYIAPFKIYTYYKYKIILNTLPKFKNCTIAPFDINSMDDSLLRYLGIIDGRIGILTKKLKNPIIWAKTGFQQIFSIPFYLLNWFGFYDDNSMSEMFETKIYRTITGVMSIITFFGSIVKIIIGWEKIIQFIKNFFCL